MCVLYETHYIIEIWRKILKLEIKTKSWVCKVTKTIFIQTDLFPLLFKPAQSKISSLIFSLVGSPVESLISFNLWDSLPFPVSINHVFCYFTVTWCFLYPDLSSLRSSSTIWWFCVFDILTATYFMSGSVTEMFKLPGNIHAGLWNAVYGARGHCCTEIIFMSTQHLVL